ncbi:MAG TPA: hypothetical protein VHN79_11600, partial [Lacunisphaera sp.]|nr:hypothetical protein [Lacunisphaera sp.]
MDPFAKPTTPSVPSPALLRPRPSFLLAMLATALLVLPAASVSGNPVTYGFFGEFVGGTLTDRLTQPYYDADPYRSYMPVMHGTFTLSLTALTDQFPDDPLRGYFVDASLGNSLN